jgi:hypothetical protein
MPWLLDFVCLCLVTGGSDEVRARSARGMGRDQIGDKQISIGDRNGPSAFNLEIHGTADVAVRLNRALGDLLKKIACARYCRSLLLSRFG